MFFAELNRFPPSFDENTPISLAIRWDLTAGAEIIRIMANDSDVGPRSSTVRYTLIPPPFPFPRSVSDGLDIFSISPTTGQITLQRALLSELGVHSQFVVTVMASDDGQPPLSVSHLLTLTPIPAPKFQPHVGEVTIDEELELGTVIPELRCIEVGPPSKSLRITLSGTGSGFFNRNEQTANLTVSRRIDYETLPEDEREFTIMAVCTNAFTQSNSTTLNVMVQNIDDNRLLFEHSRFTASVSESATTGESVLTVVASDRDVPGATVIYNLKPSEDAADFNVIRETGEIRVDSSLDRELQSVYVITVQAAYTTNSGSLERASAWVTINIDDVNDESPIFEESVYIIRNVTTLSEIGDLVVTVTANDADAGTNGQVSYQIQENSNFAINETTGMIYITSALTHGTYVLTVNATDMGANPNTDTAFVYIYVQSSPNHILLMLADNTISIPEDTPVGSQIAQVFSAVVDDSNVVLNDSTDLTVRFGIVNGSDPERFTISGTTGELFTLGSLDYDALATEYDLVIRATLTLPTLPTLPALENETIVRILVENLNDNPPLFQPTFYATTIEQFTLPNVTIIQVSATDPDRLSDPIKYTLAGEDSSVFMINSATGEISAVLELDTPQDYRFSVMASDGGAEDSTAAVFIAVTRSVSVAPVFTTNEFIFTLLENVSPGTFIGMVTAITRGNRSSLEFSHLGFRMSMSQNVNMSQNMQNLFHIDMASGNISTQATFGFDFESRQDYFFYIDVYNVNDDMVYDNATVEIQLQDENDNPPVFDQTLYTRVINASQPTNSIIAVLTATDRDSGTNSRIRYEFEGHIVIVGFALNSTSGAISVSNSTLIPGDYYLNIVASDGGIPTMTARATVYVAILPVTPSSIEFTEQTYMFEIAEDALTNTVLGTVQALETNTSLVPQGLTYTYSTPNITNCFSIDSISGVVQLSCTSLDRDDVASYELSVTAQVNNIVAHGTVQIRLLDVNDNPPVFTLNVYTKVINDRYGNDSAILLVMATDLDLGNNGTVRYDLVSPTDIFRIDAISGGVFLVGESVGVGDYRLQVRATDMGVPMNLSSTAFVLICITRAHPQSLQFASTSFSITENANASSIVGTAVLITNGGNMVNPLEFPNNLQFSIVSGNSSELFFIEPDTGIVRTRTQMLDREAAPSHVIKILANFTRFTNIPVPSVVSTFSVEVEDVNDNAPTLLDIYQTLIDDSTAANVVLFNITATDIDSGTNAEVSFSIDVQPLTVFGVRVTNTLYPDTFGEIFVNDTDALTPGTYRFTLTATDDGRPSMQTTAMVDIIVEHAIPEMISFSTPNYTFSLIEEVPQGTQVGNVSILPDTPALNDLVFEITGGGGQEFFIINSSTGELSTRHRRIDRERNTTFLISIRAFLPDQDPPLIADGNVTINIIDINDNTPMFTEGVYSTVGIDTDELNTSVSLITVLATDRDMGSNADIEYLIHSVTVNLTQLTDPTLYFVLNSSTGKLFPASVSIAVGNYLLNVSGSDRGEPRRTSYTSVPVVVQRPAPSSVSFTNASGYTFRLLEGRGLVTFARVMLEAIPDYFLEFVTYTSEDSLFSIALRTGEITATRDFDYEVEQSFTFRVTSRLAVTNRAPPIDLTAVATVTVVIVDVNDNTPFFVNFPTEITQLEERETIEVVHTIVASDSDSGSNAQLRYEILNSNLNGLLTIDPTSGHVMAAAGLDREDSAEGRTHMILIRVCDSGYVSLCTQSTTMFRLLDINDNSPRLSSGFSYNVNERLPARTEVFSFVGMDPDLGANSTVRYSLISTNVPFVCNETTGQVNLTEELDYEMRTSYIIMLRLFDTGSPILSTSYTNITVNVVNLADNTPQFNQTAYRNNTNPTVIAGDVLFQMQATDADRDTLKYAITSIQEMGNNGNRPELRIDAATGRITSGANQVFVPEAFFTIGIQVYDQSQFNLTNTTTLIITVVPNPLQFTQSDYTVNIREDAQLQTQVAVLNINSLSVSSDISYTFDIIDPVFPPGNLATFTHSGNGAPAVSIALASPGTGLDREVISRYVIEVTASRPNEVARTRLVVMVEDANDNRPIFIDANNTVVSIEEGVTTPTVVTRSNATDRDIGNNARLVFTLVEPDPDFPFEIVSDTGVIQTRGVLDYEMVRSYNLTVNVRDSGQPRRSNRIVYRINILNINDNFPSFAAPAYFGEVYAQAPVGEAILHTELSVTDADDVNNQQVLTFRIYLANQVQQVDDYRFGVDAREPYFIRVESLPDAADLAPQLIEFRLEVTDEGGKVVTIPLYISIFTTNNLATFVLQGVTSGDVLLSCDEQSSSLCAFRQTMAGLIGEGLGSAERITFYNNSVVQQDIEMLVSVGVIPRS